MNLSGHSDTAYFSPIEMRDILVELDEPFTQARAVTLGQVLPLTTSGKRSSFTLPQLGAYEVIILD